MFARNHQMEDIVCALIEKDDENRTVNEIAVF